MGKLTIQPTSIGQGKEAIMHNGDGADESKWRELAKILESDSDLKILTLAYSYTLTESKEMFAGLRANRSLEYVELKDSSIGGSLAEVIDALSENPNLKHLLLCVYKEDKNEINDAFIQSLSSLITHNPGLQKLHLEHMSFQNPSFSIFCQALATTPYLKELNLMGVTISATNRQLFLDALQANPGFKVNKLNCDEALETALGKNPYSFNYKAPEKPSVEEVPKQFVL